jgi:hypothetical protein
MDTQTKNMSACYIVPAKSRTIFIMRGIIFLCSATLIYGTRLSYCQEQNKSDFYGIKLKVINKPEIKKDLSRDWTKHYPNPTDESSRHLLFVLEELESRKLHILEVFDITFSEDGDLPGIVMNRIRYPIPDRFYEVPHTYELLEHIENYLFHHIDIARWKKEKKKIDQNWEYEEWSKKSNFIDSLQRQGVTVETNYDYEYYFYDEIQVKLDGLSTTFESLGYIETPPEYPPKPKRKGPVLGFNLWTASKKSLPTK